MDLRLLGALEVDGGGWTVRLGPPKQRALLAILALHAREIVSVDSLIDALWPEDPPRTAAHSIQIYVSELRKELAAVNSDLIVTRAPGYVLQAPDDAIDVRRFERLAEEGLALHRARDPAAREVLRAALALWRGPALSDFAYDEFAQPYVLRLGDRHLDAVEALASAELDGGSVAEAVALAASATREDSLRESAREVLMLALYRSGRHAEALRTYQQLREQLADELGLDPGPALQLLYERILLHDPTLDPTATTHAPANPYKGLRAFSELDASEFFGREALVQEILGALRAGRRLVALVGPSGSGKSSVLAAGLVPPLRSGALPGSEAWDIQLSSPGPGTLGQLEALVAGRGREPALLVLDQFEDLFAMPDEGARTRFLAALAGAVDDPARRLTVVLALRADFYDRPLLDPAFAAVFIPGVLNVMPLSRDEVAVAVAGPAQQAGLAVEPGLLADLVADTTAEPGALPLLQYALTELVERGDGHVLRLADYRAIGGLRGILARRAEDLYAELDDASRLLARQVFLRLVRVGRSGLDGRRRVPVAELADLDVDPLALSGVLDRFARRRLLSFDRDPRSGQATVEVAHEALLREWPRLAGWIDRHRADLRRHEAFSSALEEWEVAGRDSDYLLTGGRLAEAEATIRAGALALTGHECSFLEASIGQRDAQAAAETARADASRRLERRARSRLVALAVALLALALVGAYGAFAAGGVRSPVALVYNGDGVFTVSLVVQAGFDHGVSDFALTARKASVGEAAEADAAIRAASQAGDGLVVVTAVDADIDAAAAAFPNTRYVVIDLPATRPNVVHLAFADNESSFLAGVAAALTSRTGTIGFIGGADSPVIWPFEAGYEAGAKAVNPSVRVLSAYLGPDGDYNGFADPVKAAGVASAQYGAGADVIFAAAGDSGIGVFGVAATRSGPMGHWLWAIGVDTDQFVTVGDDPANTDWQTWQQHILTSVLKHMDTAVYGTLADYAHGTLASGTRTLGLAQQGVGLSQSGGFLNPVQASIEAWRARIVAGSVAVPCIPVEREAQAAASKVPPPGCGS